MWNDVIWILGFILNPRKSNYPVDGSSFTHHHTSLCLLYCRFVFVRRRQCESAMSLAQIDKILTEQNVSKLHIFLKKQSTDSLAAVSTHDSLDQLNPAVHSLGYLFILYVILSPLRWCWLSHLERHVLNVPRRKTPLKALWNGLPTSCRTSILNKSELLLQNVTSHASVMCASSNVFG